MTLLPIYNKLFSPFPVGQFDIILADPPWKHAGTNTGPNRSPGSATYPIVATKDLAELPLLTVAADDSLLFMWTCAPLIDDACWLGKQWGFRYITVAFVWDKMRTTVGFHTMPQTEFVLLFGRGRQLQKRGSRNEKQLIVHSRLEHSRKPTHVHESIERMYPSHRLIELFARQKRDGWAAWGNEI